MAATSALTSDHVNYLIWRYLQESGFGHAAAKLQQFWLREQDPQALPFAEHVDRRALVSLVHKGLKYHQIEQLHTKTVGESGTSAAALFFGTAAARHLPSSDQGQQQVTYPQPDIDPQLNGIPSSLYTQNAVKRPPDTVEDGLLQHEAKRNRRSHGPESGPEAMQVDQNGFLHAPQRDSSAGPTTPGNESQANEDVSGMDVDEDTPADLPPPLPTLADGQSVGIQSDKVRDLVPTSFTLNVPEKDVIMHTEWNPHNTTLLATGGDGLCRLWQISPDEQQDTKTPSHDILLPTEASLVTSVAWSPDGKSLALATQAHAAESVGTVSTWTDTGKALDDLTAGQELVIKLCWNDDGSMLLGVTSSGEGTSSLIVWDMETAQPLQPVQCNKIITDAGWTGRRMVAVCGHGAIGRWDVSSQQGLLWAMKLNPQITEGHWSNICFNPTADTITVFDEERAGFVIIDSNGNLAGSHQAHRDSMTALATINPTGSTPLVATSSVDGTVIHWDLSSAYPRNAYIFGSDAPPLALAFSRDGRMLAAANHNKLLVWDLVAGSTLPCAIWRGELSKTSRQAMTNGHGDKDSGIGDDADEDGLGELGVSLGWSAAGDRVALSVGSSIAIVRVRP